MFNEKYEKPHLLTPSPPPLKHPLKLNQQILYDFHEDRTNSIKTALRSIFKKLIEDPMLKLISSDKNIASEFVNSRINEIFSEIIENDREDYYSSLFEKYAQENLNLKDEYIKNSEKYEQKLGDIYENFEKTENILEFERKQNEKLSKNYSELMQKFTENSKEFDEILKKKDLELSQCQLSIKLENEDLKIKLVDFESVCETMDKEIFTKTQEIKKSNIFIDKQALKIKELEGFISSYNSRISEKEAEINDLKTYKLESEGNLVELVKEINDYKEELIRKDQFLREKELEVKSFEAKDSEIKDILDINRKVKEKFLKKKKVFKEKLLNYEEMVKELRTELEGCKKEHNGLKGDNEGLKRLIEDNERKLIELKETEKKLKEGYEGRIRDLIEGIESQKDKIKSAVFQEKERFIEIEEAFKRKLEGIKREYEKKLEIMKDKENLLKRSAAMEEKKDLRIMGSLRKTNTFIEGFKESMSAKKTILEVEREKKPIIEINDDNNKNESSLVVKSIFEEQMKNFLELDSHLKKDLDYLKVENRGLQNSLSQAIQDKDTMEIDIYRLSKSLEDSQKNMQIQEINYKNQLEALKEEKCELYEKIENLKQIYEEKNNELLACHEEINRKEQGFLEIAKKFQGVMVEKKTWIEEIERMKKGIDEKNQDFDKKSSEFEEIIKKFKEKNNALEGELNEIKRYFQEKNEENLRFSMNKEKSLSDLERNIEVYKRDVEDKGLKLKILEKAKDGLERNLSQIETAKKSTEIERDKYKQHCILIIRAQKSKKTQILKILDSLENMRKENYRLKDWLIKCNKTKENEIYRILPQILEKVEVWQKGIERKCNEKTEGLKAMYIREKEGWERHVDDMKRDNNRKNEDMQREFGRRSEELKQKINEKEEEKKQIKGEYEKLLTGSKEILEKLQKDVEISQQEMIKSKETIRKLKEESDKGREREKGLFEELQKLKKELAVMHEKHQKVLKEVSENIEKLRENQETEIKQLCQNYEEIIETLQGQLDSKERISLEITRITKEKEEKLEALEKLLEEKENEKIDLIAQLQEFEGEYERIKRRFEGDKDVLEGKIKEIQEDTKEKEHKIDALSKEKGFNEQTIKELKEKIELFSMKVPHTINQVDGYKSFENQEILIQNKEMMSPINNYESKKWRERQEKPMKTRIERNDNNMELIRSLNELKSLDFKIKKDDKKTYNSSLSKPKTVKKTFNRSLGAKVADVREDSNEYFEGF